MIGVGPVPGESLQHRLRELTPQVLGILVRRYRDFPGCEDAVQEALIAAAAQWPRDGIPDNARGWLLKVATNQALTVRRRSARVVRLDVVPDQATTFDIGARSTDRIVLLDGLADLPLQMRAAIVLRYYADLSVDEVATTLGKSPNTIKAQLQTALDRLRASLAEPVGASVREARHA